MMKKIFFLKLCLILAILTNAQTFDDHLIVDTMRIPRGGAISGSNPVNGFGFDGQSFWFRLTYWGDSKVDHQTRAVSNPIYNSCKQLSGRGCNYDGSLLWTVTHQGSNDTLFGFDTSGACITSIPWQHDTSLIPYYMRYERVVSYNNKFYRGNKTIDTAISPNPLIKIEEFDSNGNHIRDITTNARFLSDDSLLKGISNPLFIGKHLWISSATTSRPSLNTRCLIYKIDTTNFLVVDSLKFSRTRIAFYIQDMVFDGQYLWALDWEYYVKKIDIGLANLVGINELNTAEKVEVYPNPIEDLFYVKAEQNSIVQFQLFDSQGRQLNTKYYRQEGGYTFETSDLKKGVYFLKVIEQDSQQMLKLLKQ